MSFDATDRFGRRAANFGAATSISQAPIIGAPQTMRTADSIACRLWAVVAVLGAGAALTQGWWIAAAMMVLHGVLVWPDIIRYAADQGLGRPRAGLAWLMLPSAAIACMMASAVRAPATVPAAPAAQAPTASASAAQSPTAAVVRPRAGQSIADQTMTDSAKFAKVVLMGRREIEGLLVDPESARYRDVYLVSMPGTGGVLFCGHVNAKNGMGGYTGYRRFIAVPGAQAWTEDTEGFATTWNDVCRQSRVLRSAAGF
ncbi:MAG: hypothetical protein WC068_12845 [Caulobacter sp.]